MIPRNKVREEREKRGMSGLELSRRARIAPAILSGIEREKIYPYPGWRKRIGEALSIPESELFLEVEADG